MASSFNTIVLVGYAGRDAAMRSTAGGDPVADFSVATTERRHGGDGQVREETTWFRVSAFGKTAELARESVRKGAYLYVGGSLSQREWTGRDGQARQSLEVRARELRLLDKREDAAPAPRRSAPARGRPPDPGDPGYLDEAPI